MAFQELARARGLKDKTIETLVEQDYDSIESLLSLTGEDMDYMKITRAQQGVLTKWIQELRESSHASGTSGNTTTVWTSSTRTEIVGEVTMKESVQVSAEVDISLGLSENTEMEVEEYIQKHGVQDLDKFLSDQLTKYQKTPVHIAITGQSGAGKSSFINCVRDLFGDDTGAADVGVKETTMTVKSYPDPKNSNIVYWDLPGIGTEKFPREDYLKVVDFLKYDFFLILSSERFKEDDLYLAKVIHDQGKQFYFLRTKIDSDLSNDKRSKPRQHNADQLIVQVRDDCVTNLRTGELPSNNIFIISSHLEDKARYDFPVLMETIVQNAPAKKRSSLILSLTACSEKGIEEKKAELEKRIPMVARLAALDERLVQSRQDRIVDEINLYKRQFGLMEDDILKMGVDRKTLTQRSIEVLGSPGKVLLDIARGVSSTLALPFKLFRNITGIQAKHERQIATTLQEALNRCAEASLEVLHCRQGLHLDASVTVGGRVQPAERSVKVGLGKKGPQIGFKIK